LAACEKQWYNTDSHADKHNTRKVFDKISTVSFVFLTGGIFAHVCFLSLT